MPHVRRKLVPVVLLALAGTWSGACREATEIRVQVTTDVACSRVTGVLVAVGSLGELEAKPGAATSVTCTNGTLGALVVVPSGDRTAEVGIRVVMGLDGESPERCVADGYLGGCVVARRAIRFLSHTRVDVPVRLEAACINVPCDAESTCAKSSCVPTPSCQGSACTVSPPQKWTPLPSQTSARSVPFAAWSGKRLWLWSGDTSTSYTTDGLSYDPVARQWTPIPSPSFNLIGREAGAGVWTGHAFLVWGGINLNQGWATGGRYDGQAWSPTADPAKFPGLATFLGRSHFASVWADSVKKLIVWGGGTDTKPFLSDGAAYDPAFDTWAPIAASPLGARSNPGSVWVGGRMVVYGGFCESLPCDDAAAYEPATNSWSSSVHITDPGTRVPNTAMTDGAQAIFWGGRACPTCADDSKLVMIDPDTLHVEVRSGNQDPLPRHGAAAWWADGKLWFWGGASYAGDGGETVLGDGASYDLATSEWTPTPTQGAPSPRVGHVVAWTGREAIVFGGTGPDGKQLADGAALGP